MRALHDRRLVWLMLPLAAVGALWHALVVGELSVSSAAALRAVLGLETGPAAQIVSQLRLPRALASFACGSLLAMAGVLMQVLLRNPLADPYVLGISGGASVGALLAMWAGMSFAWVNGAAFVGALTVMLLVLGLSHGEGGWTPTRMVLTGVIVASGAGAVIALMLSLAPPASLPGMLFWLMGDASQVTQAAPAVWALLAGLVVMLPFGRELNVLGQGTLTAHALGVPTRALAVLIYVLASLMTAVAVTTLGAVGFVGLIVPHALRRVVGGDHRLLLPAAALSGGVLLTVADTFARSVLSPIQLPVGVVMALIGVPGFLYVLNRRGRAA